MNILLNYDSHTGHIFHDDGSLIYTLSGLDGHEHTPEATADIDGLVELKKAGFTADEIIELKKKGLL